MTRLVLTRKLNESVVIKKDDDTLVSLKVSRIDRNQVRITFEANKDIIIKRQELLKDRNTL